jgi:hypothetical protein
LPSISTIAIGHNLDAIVVVFGIAIIAATIDIVVTITVNTTIIIVMTVSGVCIRIKRKGVLKYP